MEEDTSFTQESSGKDEVPEDLEPVIMEEATHCAVCAAKFHQNTKRLQCYNCTNGFHINCISVGDQTYQLIKRYMNDLHFKWYCSDCKLCLICKQG